MDDESVNFFMYGIIFPVDRSSAQKFSNFLFGYVWLMSPDSL